MRRVFIIVFLFGLLILPTLTQADRAGDLRAQIDTRQAEIGQLDQQIAKQEKQLEVAAQQSNSLQNALATLNLTISKLNNQINRTATEIKSTNLKIDELNLNINSTSEDIRIREETLRKLLREMADSGQGSLLEVLLGFNHLSDFLVIEGQNLDLQTSINQSAGELRLLKNDLGEKVTKTETEKTKLVKLQQKLADQKKIVAAEKLKQTTLLAQTKNQEQNYKKLLTDNRRRREAFAKELEQFESQLQLELDPSKVPTARQGVLAWPVANPFVTQQFGKTAYSGRLYVSGTHNGIDLRAPLGTSVMAAADGVVLDTGDTDPVCRGASYGKWVLIKHDNGLATVYGHLSLIKVAAGQRVATGNLIAYSGQSGYATGPHVHLSVSAADGVKIMNVKSKICPGTYTMPVFDTRAYLDPILYL